ncbi:MAG: recombinase [Microvirga sp.]|nr:recombinase [Microvirga sp.]
MRYFIRRELTCAGLFDEYARQRPAAEVAGKLSVVERKIAGILRAIEDGMYQPAMKVRLSELEAEKASLTARQGPAPVMQKVSIHPNLASVYQRKVEELESLLTDMDCRDEAIETIRSMIESITLTPRQDGPGLDALLMGISPACWCCAWQAPDKRKPPALSRSGACRFQWLRRKKHGGFRVSLRTNGLSARDPACRPPHRERSPCGPAHSTRLFHLARSRRGRIHRIPARIGTLG